jgi:hypothetical protein
MAAQIISSQLGTAQLGAVQLGEYEASSGGGGPSGLQTPNDMEGGFAQVNFNGGFDG